MGAPGRSSHVAISIVIVVALGIGANVAVTSVLRNAVVGTSPYTESGGLVVLENRGAYDLGVRKIATPELSWPDFLDLAAEQHVFSSIGGITGPERTVWDAGARKRSVRRVFVTRSLFSVLGAKARMGRTLSEADFAPGAPAVVVVTTSLWRGQLGSDPQVVGRVVHVDDVPFTLAGVVDDDVVTSLRERKSLFERGEDSQCLVVPADPGRGGRAERLLAIRRQNRNRPMLTLVARLKAGTSVFAAQHEVRLISQRLGQQYPDSNRERTTDVVSLLEWRTREMRHVTPILLAVGVLAWLAACASAAGLVLADAIRRQPEMAVRHAIGASRARLARLVLWRSLRWTVPGGLLGVALARFALMWVAPGDAYGSIAAQLSDPPVMMRAAGLTLLAGVVLAGIAAWVLFHQDLALGLKEAAHPGLPSRRRALLLGVVITFQMAAATSLGLVCALLIRSMVNIVNVDVGFDARESFIVRVFLPDEGYETSQVQSEFFDDALTRLRALPAVASAAMSNTPPLSQVVVTSGGDYALESPTRPPEALGPLVTQYVSPGYFESIGMRLIRGRGFTRDDYRSGAPVIVVDEAFCRRHLPSVDPLAAGIRMGGTLFRIIGVLRDVRPDGPIGNVRPTLYALRDRRQPPGSVAHFVVRPERGGTAQLMEQVVRTLVGIDHRLVVDEPQRLDTLIADTLAQRQRTLRILVLAAVVVFMLTSFSISGGLGEFVANKTNELALRKALGASPSDTVFILGKYVGLACTAGLLVGWIGGWALAGTLSGELFGITPTDPATTIVAIVGVFAVGVGAATGPIIRALAIDPARALRSL